jgi:hypothetical protein
MANFSPAIVVITSTTGPGQAVTAVRFADVVYDYSATATITQVITAGVTTITIS